MANIERSPSLPTTKQEGHLRDGVQLLRTMVDMLKSRSALGVDSRQLDSVVARHANNVADYFIKLSTLITQKP